MFAKTRGFLLDSNTLYSADSTVSTLNAIKENRTEVGELFKKLQNPPDSFTACYTIANDLYDTYYKLTGLAISPSGSLSSFSNDFSDYDKTFMELYDKLGLLLSES